MKNSISVTVALVALLFVYAPSALADYAADWGPKVGSEMPPMAAADQDGVVQSLPSLQGENGVLIFFNRSADW